MQAHTQDRAQERSGGEAATAPAGPGPSILTSVTTSSSPNTSPLSTLPDMDSFSVISYSSNKASIPEGPPISNPCGDSVTQASNNPTSYLAFIVEHTINLCETRRSMEDVILKGLERHENLCLDAIKSAKNSLTMTRRNAVDTVKRLKDASGGTIDITFPWLDGVESGAYGAEKKSPCPAPITVTPAPLVPACPVQVPPPPVPVIAVPKDTLDTNPPALKACATTVVSSAPRIRKPVSPLPPPVVHSPDPTPTGNLPPFAAFLCDLLQPAKLPAVDPPLPTKLPAINPPTSLNMNNQIHTPRQYDILIAYYGNI
jgi:hypothetical protein